MLVILLSLALADDVRFTPDRPGLADSTGTPGHAHWMIEAGGSWRPLAERLGTSAITARLGLGDIAEARLTLPDVVFGGGDTTVGAIGAGAKVAPELGDFGLAVVPVLWLSLGDGLGPVGFTTRVSVDVAVTDGVSLWAVTDATFLDGATMLVGGGASFSIEAGGLYVNGGGTLGDDPLAGGGAWLSLGRSAQLDLGCDVTFREDGADPALMLGVSVGI